MKEHISFARDYQKKKKNESQMMQKAILEVDSQYLPRKILAGGKLNKRKVTKDPKKIVITI